VQDDTIVGVHAPGTHPRRQGIPPILNAIILIGGGSRAAHLYAFAGSQDPVRGKKAQRLQEIPSRKWAVSHIHKIPLLRPITVCQLSCAGQQSWSAGDAEKKLPVPENHPQFRRVPMTALRR
jgi:hypothetical protein